MSAQEIIDEIAKLPPEEVALLRQKLTEMESEPKVPKSSWGRALAPFVGCAEDLPSDMSVNLDHYLYGSPKRE